MVALKQPAYNAGKELERERVYTPQEVEEALLVAAWRDEHWDIVLRLIERHTGFMRLTWYDCEIEGFED